MEVKAQEKVVVAKQPMPKKVDALAEDIKNLGSLNKAIRHNNIDVVLHIGSTHTVSLHNVANSIKEKFSD